MRNALGAVLLLAAAAAAETTIPWDEADKHVGEDVTIEGRILGVHCLPLSCLLAFEPTFNRFTAVVQAADFDKLPPDKLDERYSGRRVRVRGKVVERDGKPEIVVGNADAIELVEEPRRKEREQERAARAQAEALDRMADVLERVEEITERLATVQERLDTMLANLEDREAALAAAQSVPPPPPPPTPSDGEPQPRPGYEALRSIKRGMTRADVERLVGIPQYVERGARGWTTYYYGFGRSVSFDSRGRAQAFVGFSSD